jgi:hypothetical protein
MALSELDFGRLIFLENPYTSELTPAYIPPPANNAAPGANGMSLDQTHVERQVDLNWSFKGVPHYIERAIRIPYTYVDENGITIRDYILIGYAGGGAY